MKNDVYCYREDGSFDWVVFLNASQIRRGILMIIGALLFSAGLSCWEVQEGFLTVVLPMACCLVCLAGAERISSFLSIQRAMKEQKMKGK